MNCKLNQRKLKILSPIIKGRSLLLYALSFLNTVLHPPPLHRIDLSEYHVKFSFFYVNVYRNYLC